MDSLQFNKYIKIFLNRKKIEVFIGFGLAFISPEALANCNQISMVVGHQRRINLLMRDVAKWSDSL